MTNENEKLIKEINLTLHDTTIYKKRCVGCIVLTHDNKILLQQRGNDWTSFPGCLATFGGKIKPNEPPMKALIRELKEELGANVLEPEVTSLGTITEKITQYSELIFAYFWHDKHNTITGCYEGEAQHFNDRLTILNHPNTMDDVRWMLEQCHSLNLIK